MEKLTSETAPGTSDPASWVDQHGDYLFRFAVLRVRQTELAEDLVQEVFLAALRCRDQFASASSERTWLVGILKRKIIDRFRRQHQEHPVSTVTGGGWIDELFDQSGHWKTAPARWTNPSAAFENAEFWTTFSHCLEKLPKRLADAFSLRELDSVSSEEVCKVLNVSATNLWVMMHRARFQLSRCLDIHWFDNDGGRS
jgi:RNA polymerase sigma-70 factor (ECF subfamily)